MATIEQVTAAADALIAEGQKPTLANIRAALGGGSFSTISPLLKQWRESHREEAATTPIADPAPDEITEQVQSMAGHIWQAAMQLANARLQQERETLEATRLAIEAERDEAAELADQVNGELERVTGEAEALKASLEAVNVDLAKSQEQSQLQAVQLAEQRQATKDVETELQATEQHRDELRAMLDAAKNEAHVLHEKVEAQAGTIATLTAELKAATTASIELKGQLEKQRNELVRATAEATECRARLEEAGRLIGKAEAAQEAAKAGMAEARERAAQLAGQIEQLEKQNETLQTQARTGKA